MRLRSVKILLVFLLIAMIIIPADAAKSKRRKTSRTQTQTQAKQQQAAPASISITALQGKWSANGNGTGTNPRQPGVSLSLSAENVILEIDNIKFSETTGEGMADVIFTGRITDISSNVRHLRSWEYSVPYDMKREGTNSWSFSTEYLDGEDKITLTLTSHNKAILRWEGANWDDDYPEERDTFDITCTASKN